MNMLQCLCFKTGMSAMILENKMVAYQNQVLFNEKSTKVICICHKSNDESISYDSHKK